MPEAPLFFWRGEILAVEAVYIHIPFCEKRCHYCDFTTSAQVADEEKGAYLKALEKEIAFRLKRSPKFKNPDTIFIGGGTPTSLSSNLLKALLSLVEKYFKVEGVLEYTIEANPNTLDSEKIALLKTHGVTRVSLGVQSFDDERLKYLGRLHTSSTVEKVVQALREAGFKRINLDLMYGLPHTTLMDWQKEIKTALALDIDHLSLYQLKIEAGTPFATWQERGDFLPFSDEVAREMLNWHTAYLKQAGYHAYELSNFAKAGQASLHNQCYWQLHDYLGLGLGATGFIRPRRYENTREMTAYLRGDWEAFSETLSQKEQMSETVFMGLRQTRGLSYKRFFKLYGKSFTSVYQEVLQTLVEKGLLEIDQAYCRLTQEGRALGNEVFMNFI